MSSFFINMRIFAISNMNKKHENTDKLIQV